MLLSNRSLEPQQYMQGPALALAEPQLQGVVLQNACRSGKVFGLLSLLACSGVAIWPSILPCLRGPRYRRHRHGIVALASEAGGSSDLVTFGDVKDAALRIADHVVRTPVLTNSELDNATGHSVFLKCESLQKTGSFKLRGAMNAVLSLSDEVAERGVVCHSSGNFGAAVAAAACARGVPSVVVVPRTTAQVKIDAIKKLGARIVLCEPTGTARRAAADAAAANMNGAKVLHPYDQAEVIAGQGTVGLELMDQVPDLDAILVPTSGGGMLTGIAVAVRGQHSEVSCRVHAVEPAGKLLGQALAAGQRVVDPANADKALPTICDAMPTRCLGKLPWKLAHEQRLVDQTVFSVDDSQVINAMQFAFERLNLVIEPAAATGLAALLEGQVPRRADGRPRRIGVILCGGNVDVRGTLPWQKP